MPKLPSALSLGERPQVQDSRIMPSYRGGQVEEAAVQAGDAAARVGANVAATANQIGDHLALLQQRDSLTQEATNRARGLTDYNEQVSAELRRLQTEGDFSTVDTIKKFGDYTRNLQSQMVQQYGGSDMSKSMLDERLGGVRAHFGGQAATIGMAAREKVLGNAIDKSISTYATSVLSNPASISDAIKGFDADVDNYSPALTPQQEIDFRSIGRRQIAASALEAYTARNNSKAARELMANTPGLAEMLGPDKMRQIDSQLATIDNKEQEGVRAGQKRIDEFTTIMRRQPTLAERSQMALGAPSQKAPIFQDYPTDNGNKVQKMVSYDNGTSWTRFGDAYDRREPYIMQQIVQPDGTVQTVAVPRASIGQAATTAPTGAPPAPGPGQVPQQASPSLPSGSVVVSSKAPVMNSEQSNAALFADRMKASNAVLAKVEGQGESIMGKFLGAVPGGNFLQTDDYQKYDQARRDFMNAVLRRESGAAISKSEFDNGYAQYFPKPGDGNAVIEQKRKNREIALEGIARAAGPAYTGQPQNTPNSAVAQQSNGPPRFQVDLDGNIIGGNK